MSTAYQTKNDNLFELLQRRRRCRWIYDAQLDMNNLRMKCKFVLRFSSFIRWSVDDLQSKTNKTTTTITKNWGKKNIQEFREPLESIVFAVWSLLLVFFSLCVRAATKISSCNALPISPPALLAFSFDPLTVYSSPCGANSSIFVSKYFRLYSPSLS